MTYNNLTGHVIANIDYRLKQTDDSSQVEDHGIIGYDLVLSSGTGVAQINEVWYSEETFTTTDNVDLGFLSQARLGQTFNTSFIGIGGTGNIKGFKVDNLSNENIYVNVPFGGCSGNFKIAPSGSFTISNVNGWPISSSNTIVRFSGDTSNAKNYNVGLLGVAYPAILNVDGLLNYEFISSGDAGTTGTLLIEYIASSVHTGTLQLEYLAAHSSIDSGVLNIEYLSEFFFGATGTGTGIGSGTGTMIPIEYLTTFSGVDGILNIEYSGFAGTTGVSGSSTQELLQNTRFLVGCVTCENFQPQTDRDLVPSAQIPCVSGVKMVLGYPGWQVSGDFWSLTPRNDYTFILGNGRWFDIELSIPPRQICPPILTYLPGQTAQFEESYIKQTVTVIPGATYKFEWVPVDLYVPSATVVGWPTVRLISRNNTVLAEQIVTQQWHDAHVRQLQSLTAVATDDRLTVEFRVPVDIPFAGVDQQVNNSMRWGGATQTDGRVSLYRIA